LALEEGVLLTRGPTLRFDLWRWAAATAQWMRSPRLWNGLLFGLVAWVFVLVNSGCGWVPGPPAMVASICLGLVVALDPAS